MVELHKIFLLTSEVLQATNGTTIAQLFIKSMSLLWPDGVEYDKVLLLVTDAAPYMKKAAKALKTLFPKMTHITRLAHALHRIAEEIRRIFPEVDKLISNCKKVFLKSPSRCEVFREHAPMLALPPRPIITRWGTWLDSALYYAKNFNIVKEIVNKLDREDAASIRICQEVMDDPEVFGNLIYIATHFKNLPDTITKLEKKESKMCDSLRLFEETVDELSNVPGDKGIAIKTKCDKVIAANLGLHVFRSIRNIFEGRSEENIPDMTPDDIAAFEFAPVTSTEVERSFSALKHLLSDRRLSFTEDNVKKMIVASCNSI